MIEFARAAVPAAGITWQPADAEALPFEDGSFDVVVCAFGVMFLPDKVQGFREAPACSPRVGCCSRTHGTLSRTSRRRAPSTGMSSSSFPTTRPLRGNAVRLPRSRRIRADLAEAGWENVQLDDVRIESQSPSALDFATGFAQGTPLVGQLTERGADAAEVARDLVDRLQPIGGDEPFKATLAATVISAAR
jgi:hypothetical protein